MNPMVIRDLLMFSLILLAFAAYAHAEAYMEGGAGWKWNPKWWHIPLGQAYLIRFVIALVLLPYIVKQW